MSTISRSVATERQHSGVVAGEGLLHPLAILAVAVLLVNDHVLKGAFPGPVTGKLSDFAGLAFFPVFLQAVWELTERTVCANTVRSRSVLFWASALTAFGFALVKTAPACAEAYRLGMGVLRWPLFAAFDLATGNTVRPIARVALACDPTDLVALPLTLLGVFVMQRSEALGER